MKISDRDKKLILIVLLIFIIALPIVFFIKPRLEKTKALTEELNSLTDRYEYLLELSAKQENYEKRIVELNAQRDEMIKIFPGDIKKENTIMFLRRIETSQNPMWFSTMAFGEYEEESITDADVNEQGEYTEGLNALKLQTTITYMGEYEDLKALLDYVFNYDDKMIISSISMDAQTDNQIKGTFVLDQFAVTGADNIIKDANIPNMLHGNDRIFPYYINEQNVNDYFGVEEEEDEE